MPLRPNPIERLLIRIGIIPTALLDTGINLFQASALLTAGDIRLFNHLQHGPLSAEELAQRTKCSVRGVKILLNCMVNMAYLDMDHGRYSLSKAVKRSFPVDLFPDMVPFFRAVNTKLNDATEAVRNDPPGGIMGWDMVKSGVVGSSYQAAMRWLGSSTVHEVVAGVGLGNAPATMLDIGGSHGLYCVEFCRKYPSLRATVLDWSIGLENAKTTLTQETDVAARIDLYECDFEKEALPNKKYDLVFLGNIIHGLNEEDNQVLLRKIAASTTSGATIAILDQFSGVTGSPFVRGVASLIGWNLFLFAGGRAYEFELVKSWLESHGFRSIALKHLKRSPGFSVITASRGE